VVIVFPDPEEIGENWEIEPGTSDWRSDPVYIASQQLADKLGARLKSEDDTGYED
jgi:hypothetical protein